MSSSPAVLFADDELIPFIAPTASPDNTSIQRLRSSPSDGSEGFQDTTRVARRLYISHFLSTWNSRVFEFGAVLYLASIYPGTLMPMSAYALIRGLSTIFLSSAVGQYIDTGNRLQVVRLSIVLQRLVVAGSCAIFYILAMRLPLPSGTEPGLLVSLSLLACLEKLSAIMNVISIERDWVVVVAGDDQKALRTINAQMRRIDLMCKLMGPLFIALIDGISTKSAIMVNLGMNVLSVIMEYVLIAKVYYEVPELQQTKSTSEQENCDAFGLQTSRAASIRFRIAQFMLKNAQDFTLYFKHPVFLPSFAGAILYLTVLSFAGQMVTYLLSAGYDSTRIGISRTFSVVFEVLATWVAPWLMERIGPVRAGLWFASWQMTCLIAGVSVFWTFTEKPVLSASGLVGGTILSRIGLRGFELCTQVLIQEDVESSNRGSFSSVEAAWQNVFELCSFLSTLIFSRPEQFKWPTLLSVIAVVAAGELYTTFVYLRRGHLLHVSECVWPSETKRRPKGQELELDTIASRNNA